MHIKTFGFEKEFFATKKDGSFVFFPPGLASYSDRCGYLVEARGEHHRDAMSAWFLLLAAQAKLADAANADGFVLHNVNTFDVPREHMRLCLRKYGKDTAKSYFMGGHVYRTNAPRAGLHIHFGFEEQIAWTDDKGSSRTRTYTPMVNFPRIIHLLDKEFMPIIKAAKRMPGEYELKSYGFEYRSLPTDVGFNEIKKALDIVRNDME